MKVLDPGHYYSLDVFDGDEEQNLTFMHRIGHGYPGNQGEPYNGTNCQEVLRALIDRVKYLNNQVPCIENGIILASLRDALLQFEIRAARRHKRILPKLPRDIENISTCKQCGHIHCDH